MQLSRRSDYALRVLFTLAESHGGPPISIRHLSEVNDAPKPFLEHIMLDLKKQGWVKSAKGKQGGYTLARPPAEITMGEIVRHFDGLLAPIDCVSTQHYAPCSQEHRCRFRRVFLDIRNFVVHHMDRASLAAVLEGEPVSRREVFAGQGLDGEGI